MFLCLGSSIAQHTGKTLHHRVIDSTFFKEKQYAKSLVDAFMQLDRELKDGNLHYFSTH